MAMLRLHSTFRPRGPPMKSAADQVVCNEHISADRMRVVFTDPVTNQNKHEILSKHDAIKLARAHDLDLILINADADPPVCKLAKFGHVLQEVKQKEKDKRQNQKAQSVKEMTMTVGIDLHDFQTKMGKVKGFIEDGHPVKVSLLSKRRVFSRAALARQGRNTVTTSISDLDEATLQIFTSLENSSVMVQQNDFYTDIPCPPTTEGSFLTITGQSRVKAHHRREFLITPKNPKKKL